jgi:hypothetical protein
VPDQLRGLLDRNVLTMLAIGAIVVVLLVSFVAAITGHYDSASVRAFIDDIKYLAALLGAGVAIGRGLIAAAQRIGDGATEAALVSASPRTDRRGGVARGGRGACRAARAAQPERSRPVSVRAALLAAGVPPAIAAVEAPRAERAMLDGHITTQARASMFLGQVLHESVGLRYFEEIASGAAYEGRRDLGNTHTGDGAATRAAARSSSPAARTTGGPAADSACRSRRTPSSLPATTSGGASPSCTGRAMASTSSPTRAPTRRSPARSTAASTGGRPARPTSPASAASTADPRARRARAPHPDRAPVVPRVRPAPRPPRERRAPPLAAERDDRAAPADLARRARRRRLGPRLPPRALPLAAHAHQLSN